MCLLIAESGEAEKRRSELMGGDGNTQHKKKEIFCQSTQERLWKIITKDV